MLGSFWSSAHRNPAQQEFEQQKKRREQNQRGLDFVHRSKITPSLLDCAQPVQSCSALHCARRASRTRGTLVFDNHSHVLSHNCRKVSRSGVSMAAELSKS